MLAYIAHLDVTDVLSQELHVFLTTEVYDRISATTLAFLNMDMEAIRLYRLILLLGRIEIGERDWRYVKVARMTGNGQEVVDHTALESVDSQFALIGDFSIVAVKVLGEFNNRLFDEFEVAHATDHYAKVDGVVGLHLSLVKRCRDIEFSHTT